MIFKNKVYDVLKWLCLIALPAVSVFYAVVDSVFNIGRAKEVAIIISALSTFIGTLIGISTVGYKQ